MSVAEVKRLPIVNFQNIPECLRELADRIEAGERLTDVNNLVIVASSPGDIHPVIYSFGSFDAIRDVGILQSAMHDLLTCRQPFRPAMEKTK